MYSYSLLCVFSLHRAEKAGESERCVARATCQPQDFFFSTNTTRQHHTITPTNSCITSCHGC